MSKEVYQGGYYKVGDEYYLEVFDCQDGYEFTLYDAQFNEIDGGILESEDWLEEDFVVKESVGLAGCESIDYEITENFLEYYL